MTTDDLLTPTDRPAAADDALFRRTVRRLRWVRWRRRLAVASTLPLAFAAGWFAKPTPLPEVVTRTVEVERPAPPPAAEPPPPPTAEKLELAAELADGPAAGELYRRAGDLFLAGHDYPNAARCYRLFVRASGAAARTPSADDSWLLASVKTSTRPEDLR